MFFGSRTLNIDLITEVDVDEKTSFQFTWLPPGELLQQLSVVSQSSSCRNVWEKGSSSGLRLNWRLLGHCRHFCHFLLRTSQTECWLLPWELFLHTKEEEKVFPVPVYIFSGLQLFGLLPNQSAHAKASDSRGFYDAEDRGLTGHGKPLMLLIGSKTPNFLETGTLSTATENGPTPRLDGLLMVQNLKGTMSTNQYISTKTCSERILW